MIKGCSIGLVGGLGVGAAVYSAWHLRAIMRFKQL